MTYQRNETPEPLAAVTSEVPIPQTDDPDAWVRFWLDSALRCPAFVWDADQRACAEGVLADALAKAQAAA